MYDTLGGRLWVPVDPLWILNGDSPVAAVPFRSSACSDVGSSTGCSLFQRLYLLWHVFFCGLQSFLEVVPAPVWVSPQTVISSEVFLLLLSYVCLLLLRHLLLFLLSLQLSFLAPRGYCPFLNMFLQRCQILL